MKKLLAVLLALLLFCLAACSSSSGPAAYTVEVNGELFAVDTEKCTVTHGNDVYEYVMDGDTIDITYPNGAVYWWRITNHGGVGGWDDNYDEERYVSGSTLVNILESEMPEVKDYTGKIILFAVLVLLGLWQLIWPRTAWYWAHGWQYKNAEPSDAGLIGARAGGVLFIVIAVVQFFV